MNYRVIAIKEINGVAVGITGSNFIGSYYLPHGNSSKPLSLNDGYFYAISKIHAREPQGKPLVIGTPIKTQLGRNARRLAGKALGRTVTFNAIPPEERGTELDLAKDALIRRTNIEEVL